jgi:hypothetical protein
MKITIDDLETFCACPEGKVLFLKTFGKSVEVTYENCLEAVNAGLDVVWCVGRFCGLARRQAFNEDIAAAQNTVYEAEHRVYVNFLDNNTYSLYRKTKDAIYKAYQEAKAKATYKALTGKIP